MKKHPGALHSFFMSTNLFDDQSSRNETHHLQGASKVFASSVWVFSTCACLILAPCSTLAVTLEPPSHGWIVELPQEERQIVVKMLRSEQFAQLDQRYNTLQEQYEQVT